MRVSPGVGISAYAGDCHLNNVINLSGCIKKAPVIKSFTLQRGIRKVSIWGNYKRKTTEMLPKRETVL